MRELESNMASKLGNTGVGVHFQDHPHHFPEHSLSSGEEKPGFAVDTFECNVCHCCLT